MKKLLSVLIILSMIFISSFSFAQSTIDKVKEGVLTFNPNIKMKDVFHFYPYFSKVQWSDNNNLVLIKGKTNINLLKEKINNEPGKQNLQNDLNLLDGANFYFFIETKGDDFLIQTIGVEVISKKGVIKCLFNLGTNGYNLIIRDLYTRNYVNLSVIILMMQRTK